MVDIEDGEEGIELLWEEGGGLSNKGKEERRGSLSINSGSSSSLRLMIFLASSASMISRVDVCYKKLVK